MFTCDEPGALAKLEELVARLDELQVRRASLATRDPLGQHTLDAEHKASQAALDDIRQRLDANLQKASIDGFFDVVDTSALNGRTLTRGDVVGYVVPSDARTVRLAIDERWIARFDGRLKSVALRINGADGHANVYSTSVVRRTPKATRMVASAALSSYGGGRFAADENGDGRLLKEAVFDIELAWPDAAESAAVGSHVGVRLVYEPAPLKARLSTVLRQAISDRVAS